MKRSHGFLILTALLSIGVSGVVYRSVHSGTETPAEHGSASTRPPAGGAAIPESAELAELRQELVQLRHQVWAQGQGPAAPAPAQADADPAAAKDPRTDPETRAEHERQYREYLAGIDAAFHKEAPDPQWSSAAASVVSAALVADDDLRPLARGVECRSRTCRVEIADDGSGKLGKILPMFAQQVSESLPSATAGRIEDANGGVTMVLYMSRREETPAMAP